MMNLILVGITLIEQMYRHSQLTHSKLTRQLQPITHKSQRHKTNINVNSHWKINHKKNRTSMRKRTTATRRQQKEWRSTSLNTNSETNPLQTHVKATVKYL